MNLVKLALERTSSAETPSSFFYWATLCSISAVVKRNVWINKKIYKLYPNLYVILIAKSGLRKGAATSFARNIVDKVEVTRVIYGRSSIQGIVNELANQYTFENGKVLNTACGFVISGELASTLIGDPQGQIILTDLYDSSYHANWTNMLKGSGKEKLKDIYVTFLAATNPTLLDNFLDESSIQGGFIARTLLIKEDRKSKINPLISNDDSTSADAFDDAEIVSRLKEISKVKGQFKFTKPAMELYVDWYKKFNEKLDGGYIRDSTGTSDRIHDHILKVSMNLSLADTLDLTINETHIQEAISVCTGSTVKVAEGVGQGKGKSDLAGKTKIFMDLLLSVRESDYTLSREEVLNRHFKDFDAFELDTIVSTLTQGKVIDIVRGDGLKVYYQLNNRFVGEIDRMLRK